MYGKGDSYTGTQRIKTLLTSAIISSAIYALPAQADIYQIFWPEENLADPENNPNDKSWQNIKITNISSNTVVDGTLSGVYSQDLSGKVAHRQMAANIFITANPLSTRVLLKTDRAISGSA